MDFFTGEELLIKELIIAGTNGLGAGIQGGGDDAVLNFGES